MNVPMPTPADWDAWLAAHHAGATEIWLRLYKKHSGTPSITWEDGVIGALIWGWIDGQKKPLDDVSWLQRFTPRKPHSNWSLKNRGHAERLIAEGRMQPAGMAHILAAQADGRWDTAYAGSKDAVLPPDFLQALAGNPALADTFATWNAANRFVVTYRLGTARTPTTRAKRLAVILEKLASGGRFH